MSELPLSKSSQESSGNDRLRIAWAVLQEMEVLAERLPKAEDQRFLTQFLAAEQSRSELAETLGIPRSNLKRRAARLVSRVLQPAFQSAVVNMRLLHPAEQALAREAVLAGRPVRELSRIFGVSIHEILKRRSALCAKLLRLAGQPTQVRCRMVRQLNRDIVTRQQARSAVCRDLAVVLSVCSVLLRAASRPVVGRGSADRPTGR